MPTAWTIVVLVVALGISWKFIGSYMEAVYERRVNWLRFIEGPIYRICGIDDQLEQGWRRYATSLVVFSGVALGFTYLILRLQGHLGLNPLHQHGVTPALAFNTSVSFVTNTNWQNYSGETTMSFFSQMIALASQMFISASVGMAVAVGLVRGFKRQHSKTIGNFWVDLTRGILYILLPIAFIASIIFVAQGAVDTLSGSIFIHNPLDGFKQLILLGPVASMEAIKELGTNGGGFFNANGAHPFENPTGLTNILSIYLILLIPVGLTYTFGKMVGSTKQGLALLTAMAIFFFSFMAIGLSAEQHTTVAVAKAGITHSISGNMVGKESRFGASSSVLYNVASTQTSTGSVNSSLDSYTPIGGLTAMGGMMLGEVTPGGVGSGLYTILLFAIVTVFVGGLMVGRTPEYLGKKIQAREVKLAAIGVLIMPITVLVASGIAVSLSQGRAGVLNPGPHGFSEILYAFTSQGNNNGSAFAGLSSNTAFYNIAGAVVMLIGRFGVILPALALGGALAEKGVVAPSLGTFRTDSILFCGLLVGVILIIGGLTFFPALSLGPLAEQLSHGRLF